MAVKKIILTLTTHLDLWDNDCCTNPQLNFYCSNNQAEHACTCVKKPNIYDKKQSDSGRLHLQARSTKHIIIMWQLAKTKQAQV